MKNKLVSISLLLAMLMSFSALFVTPVMAEEVGENTLALAPGDDWDSTTDIEWEGDGSSATPYQITSAEELAGLAQQVNAGSTYADQYFELTTNIYLNDLENLQANYLQATAEGLYQWTPIGYEGKTETKGFGGHFDGLNHVVYGLWINQTTTGLVNHGLFGRITGGSIKNLTVDRSYFIGGTWGQERVGFIAARIAGSVTIENCHVSNVVVGGNQANLRRVGGIVGNINASDVTITKCTVDNALLQCSNTGLSWGFIAGYVEQQKTGLVISDCVVTNSTITGTYQNRTGNSVSGIGGILGEIGYACAVEITGCKVLSVHVDGGSGIGGILGNTGSNPYVYIDDCYVSGDFLAAGFDANDAVVNPQYAYVDANGKTQRPYLTYTNGSRFISENAKYITIGGVVGNFSCTSSGSKLTVVNSTVDADIQIDNKTAGVTPVNAKTKAPLNSFSYVACAGGVIGRYGLTGGVIGNNYINARISVNTVAPDTDAITAEIQAMRDNLATEVTGTFADGTSMLEFAQSIMTETITVNHWELAGGLVGSGYRTGAYFSNNFITGTTEGAEFGLMFGGSELNRAWDWRLYKNNVATASFGCTYDVAKNTVKGSTYEGQTIDFDGVTVISEVTDAVLPTLEDHTYLEGGTGYRVTGENPKASVLVYTDWQFGTAPDIAAASLTMGKALSVNFYVPEMPRLAGTVAEVAIDGVVALRVDGITKAGITYGHYTTDGIKPANLDQPIKVTAKMGDITADQITYSVLDYATRKYAPDNQDKADLNGLLVALATYGDAAKVAAGQASGMLNTVTGVAYDPATLQSDFDAIADTLKAQNNPSAYGFDGISIHLLADKVTPVLKLKAGVTSVSVAYPWIAEPVVYTAEDFITDEHGNHLLVLDEIYATDLNNVVEITSISDNEDECGTCRWNVASFVLTVQTAEGMTDAHKSLAQALALYMKAVRVYAGLE